MFLQECGELIEVVGPEPLVAVEPFVGFVHRLCAQPAGNRAAAFAAGDQPGVRQYVEMLHHSRQRYRKRLSQRANRKAIGLAQPGDHGAPRGVGERSEGAVERGASIVNHLVKYRGLGTAVKAGRRARRRREPGIHNPALRCMDFGPYWPTAAWISLTASSLAHSAGPAIVPISQPSLSTSRVVGMPKARPISFKSWKVLAVGSV